MTNAELASTGNVYVNDTDTLDFKYVTKNNPRFQKSFQRTQFADKSNIINVGCLSVKAYIPLGIHD